MILSFQYILLKLLLLRKFNFKIIINKIKRYIYVIDDFKINFLLDFDILDFEKMNIDYKYKIFIIDNYREMNIFMIITLIKNKIKRIMKIFDKIIILNRFNIMIFIKFRDNELLKKRDFMFILIDNFDRFKFDDDVITHIIDINMCII